MLSTSGLFSNGREYKENSIPQESRAKRALENISDWKNIKSALDIGCGDGKITRYISDKLEPDSCVIGIDQSADMIEVANGLSTNTPNLQFIQEKAENLQNSIGSKKFDLITSFFCLQWVKRDDFPTVMNTLFSHLNENGILCILLPCFDAPHQIIRGVAASPTFNQYLSDYEEKQTLYDLDSINTLDFESKITGISFSIESSSHWMTPESFIRYTSQWQGCYKWLENKAPGNSALQEAFADAIKERVTQERDAGNGEFEIIQTTLHMTRNMNFSPTIQSSIILGKSV